MCISKFVLLIGALIFALSVDVVASQGNTFNSTIRFYRGPTISDFVSFNLTTAENVANDPHFNILRKSVIFFHGWQQSPDSPASQILLNAYLANGTYNILALDWREAASSVFLDLVVQRVEPLGIAVALFIDRWNSQKGVPFSKMHLVGHSLGAHLAGSAGKYTRGWSGKTKSIERITGLDPAIVAVDFLHWSFANFVDIIHTDANGSGTNLNNGHVDFWPNNGVAVQPGCPSIVIDPVCSHMRAILLYAESVRRAYRSGNFLSTNNANANIVIEMGLNSPATAQGVYTLYTNGASLYSQS
ncbi:hypothetical protein HA402_004913 [Bradysia odoriphaga]|nr:hypothetical protein HA402_004913 [Bradysia odoriphaga]